MAIITIIQNIVTALAEVAMLWQTNFISIYQLDNIRSLVSGTGRMEEMKTLEKWIKIATFAPKIISVRDQGALNKW